jgi:hypothetical protein
MPRQKATDDSRVRAVNDPMQAIASLPAPVARMLAVEILLTTPKPSPMTCSNPAFTYAREN